MDGGVSTVGTNNVLNDVFAFKLEEYAIGCYVRGRFGFLMLLLREDDGVAEEENLLLCDRRAFIPLRCVLISSLVAS